MDRTSCVVIGAGGGIGRALVSVLEERGVDVLGLGRNSDPPLDLLSEDSIASAAKTCGDGLRLVIDATGFLHAEGMAPERSWRQIEPAHMAHAFAVNAIGPALLMKHFLPRLHRSERAVFATLSARVGSIGDNRLGGWYSYRASKAALNQLVRCAAIELRRTSPVAICVSIHPGTVATGLSAPFSKSGLDVRDPDAAAFNILAVLDALSPADNGGFFDHRGEVVAF